MSSKKRQKIKILIADYDPGVINTMKGLLKDNDHQVEIAMTYMQAINQIKNNCFDCLIVDFDDYPGNLKGHEKTTMQVIAEAQLQNQTK